MSRCSGSGDDGLGDGGATLGGGGIVTAGMTGAGTETSLFKDEVRTGRREAARGPTGEMLGGLVVPPLSRSRYISIKAAVLLGAEKGDVTLVVLLISGD